VVRTEAGQGEEEHVLQKGPEVLWHIHTYLYIHIYTCIHAYPHMYTYTRIYTHTYIHAYIHVYTHIYIYAYTHTHTYTLTHTYIYTYTHTYIHPVPIHIRAHMHTYTHITYQRGLMGLLDPRVGERERGRQWWLRPFDGPVSPGESGLMNLLLKCKQHPSTEVLLVRRRKRVCSMTRLQSCRVNPRLSVTVT
jgi:hypothetical protein